MKNLLSLVFVCAIAVLLMSFINPGEQIKNQSEMIPYYQGTVTNADYLNGCMTIEYCSGGSKTFGIIAGGNGTGYPGVNDVIEVFIERNNFTCNQFMLKCWGYAICD